jgi:hypothetical protein
MIEINNHYVDLKVSNKKEIQFSISVRFVLKTN